MVDIVIVEDEEPIRVLTELVFQEHGHNTLSASTVDQASALLESDKNIHLLFTEIGLQGDVQSGLMLAQEAIRRRSGLGVLYTSGQGVTDGMRELFVEKSAFLPKPYTVDQLLTSLIAHFSFKVK